MKKLLVLAGNSVKNRAWGEACAEYFRGDFDMTFFLEYDHWNTEAQKIDLAVEIQKIKETVEGTGETDDWYVFAKSIGSVLTLKAIEQGVIAPEKCVFFGMSLNVAAAEQGEDWSYLSEFSQPALAFHNDADPVAEYDFVVEKLRAFAPAITLRTVEGNTHDYTDFASYAEEVRHFLAV
jgi:hypothetical protein